MTGFVNIRHVEYCGWVAGIAARNGVPLEPVRDQHGHHTDRLRLTLPDDVVDLVVPPPPDEWAMPDDDDDEAP